MVVSAVQSCHMGSPQKIGGGSTGLPCSRNAFTTGTLARTFLTPAACHSCHSSEFTVADMQNLIPYIKEQHGVPGGTRLVDLPPFNGEVQVAMTAHGAYACGLQGTRTRDIEN